MESMRRVFAIVLLPVLFGCGEPAARTSLTPLIGKEVQVNLKPTVITTATTSEVRKDEISGKLVQADSQWVILDTGNKMVAARCSNIVTIVEK